MAQIAPLVKTLKKQLKAHGKTYSDVAALLELSEASVKRLFSDHNFTLDRLELICNDMGLELSELVQIMLNEQQQVTQLTYEQEQKIAEDLLLLMVTACVINGYSYEDLIDQYAIKPTELIQKLAVLDRLKMIELLPGNRIKLLISPNFSWLPNGPIQRFYQEKVEQDFFNSRFDKRNEKLIVTNGLLSDEANAEFQRRMRRLANEFNDLSVNDRSLPIKERHGTTIVLAVRQWQYTLFEEYAKKQ